jgi:ABC-type polysaccharide/polyol phosphate export permease
MAAWYVQMTGIRLLFEDIVWSISQKRKISALASAKLQRQYFGLMLGQVWNVMNFLVTVAIMSTVYAIILGIDYRIYVPHLAIGLLVWESFTWQLQESNGTISSFQSIAMEFPFPPMLYFVVSNRVVAHQYFQRFVIVILLLSFQGSAFFYSPELLFVPIGIVMTFLCGFFLSLAVSMVAIRLRDLIYVLNAFLRLAFLATPIIWMPGMHHEPQWLSDFNPLYHMIEIIRSPLLGRVVSPLSYGVVTSGIFIGAGICAILYPTYKNKYLLWSMK